MTSSDTPPAHIRLSLRIDLPNGARLGPGKAQLLRKIKERGSIAGAARAMNLSYPKASRLVSELNAAFREPLVQTEAGGSRRGGAVLTDLGAQVLALYEDMGQKALQVTADGRDALAAAINKGL